MDKKLIFVAIFLAFGLPCGWPGLAIAAPVSGQGTWETTLQGRDLDGDLATIEAFYDTELDITWLADASLGSRRFWEDANDWAESLDPFDSGITGWRLPNLIDAEDPGPTFDNFYQGVDAGYNISVFSEMSYLFYITLANTSRYTTDPSGVETGCINACTTNTGPFENLINFAYWTNSEFNPFPGSNTSSAGFFDFGSGLQSRSGKTAANYAWAVHDGDVGAVIPVPAAVWLFTSGLLGLLGLARRSPGR